MEFEFNESKSDANKQKHGLDFYETRQLWLDPDAVELPARSEKEERKMLIARF